MQKLIWQLFAMNINLRLWTKNLLALRITRLYVLLTWPNCPKSFESTLTIETGLSDFDKLIATIQKVKHEKVPPKIIQYRDYKIFDSTRFFEKLSTAWKVSKYGVFFTPYLSVFSPNAGEYGPEKTPYLDTFHAV